MRLVASFLVVTVLAIGFFQGCGSGGACQGAVSALCVRALACNAPAEPTGTDPQAVFVTGTTALYMATNYGPQHSCEDQMDALCPTTDLTPAQQTSYAACENAAPQAMCGMVPGSVGAFLPDACTPLYPIFKK